MAEGQSNKWGFLKSVRFWKIFVIAVLMAFQKAGVIDGGIVNVLAQIVEITLGGSVILRTVDRAAEKSGSADTS